MYIIQSDARMQTKADFSPHLPTDLLHILDPNQVAALTRIGLTDNTWIYGGDLQKRLEVLLHMMMQNAFRGQTTLICIDDEGESELIHELTRLGLDTLYMHLKKPIPAGAMGALQVARKKKSREDTEAQSDLAISKYMHWLQTEESRFAMMAKRTFGEMSWKEVLDKNALAPWSPFRSQLAASLVIGDFSLSHQEYWALRGRIKTFQRLRVLRTPAFDALDKLHDGIFEKDESDAPREHVQMALNQIIDQGRKLLGQIGDLVFRYRRDISGVHHDSIHVLRHKLQAIREKLQSGELQFGQEFYAESTFNDITNRLRRSINARAKALHKARVEVKEDYLQLLEILGNSPVKADGIEVLLQTEALTIEDIREGIAAVASTLDAWASRIDAQTADHKKRLNALNIPPGHPLRKLIQDTETDIQKYISWANSLRILGTTVEINALSLEKRSLVIRQVVTLCTKLKEALVDFEAYFLWRRFWSQLDGNLKMLLEALDILDESEQINAFDRWYIGNVLDRVPPTEIAREVPSLEGAYARIRDMKAVLINHVKTQMQQQRYNVLSAMRKTQKALVQNIASGNYSAVTDELHVLPAKDLARLFPFVVCTPTELRDYAYYFDRLCVLSTNGADFRSFFAQSQRCVLLTEEAPQVSGEHTMPDVSRLGVRSLKQTFTWHELPATGKLQKLQSLASQLHPFLRELRVYNAKGLQIFSFLGDSIDARILESLDLPYKAVGEPSPTLKQLTEALLDVRKPIVLLIRDALPGYHYTQQLLWQVNAVQYLRDCGINVINSWSIHWKDEPQTTLQEVVHAVDRVYRETGEVPSQPEQTSSILDDDDDTRSAALQDVPEDQEDGEQDAGVRSGSEEMGGIHA